MKSNWQRFLPLYILTCLIVLLPVIPGIVYWQELPDNVAIHFSVTGTPNGFCNKTTAVYFFPIMSFICQLIIIISYIFSNDKNIPSVVEIISCLLFPVCSILCGIMVYKDFMNINIKTSTVFIILFSVLAVMIFILIYNIIKSRKRS